MTITKILNNIIYLKIIAKLTIVTPYIPLFSYIIIQ